MTRTLEAHHRWRGRGARLNATFDGDGVAVTEVGSSCPHGDDDWAFGVAIGLGLELRSRRVAAGVPFADSAELVSVLVSVGNREAPRFVESH